MKATFEVLLATVKSAELQGEACTLASHLSQGHRPRQSRLQLSLGKKTVFQHGLTSLQSAATPNGRYARQRYNYRAEEPTSRRLMRGGSTTLQLQCIVASTRCTRGAAVVHHLMPRKIGLVVLQR